MVKEQRVLVVNGQPETEEVLKVVLEPRGFKIDRVSHQAAMDEADLPQKPRLIVLHEESPSQPQAVSNDSYHGVPRVIIGSMFTPKNDAKNGEKRLSQPFQYGELIQMIDHLLKNETTCSK
ncbi:hypothetical protein MNBD_PLANCTO02-1023 [hydrothermal vent metagenome]|uniref:Uncharacterized protein n=1 Tax=hydrothermal vent metagenome TaxID=652676 RepID=A0A3B1DD08_9ZZZZ